LPAPIRKQKINIMKNLAFIIGIVVILANVAFTQNGAIKGKVLDELKEAIPGANITFYVNGDKKGTVTDENGNFTIKPLQPGSYDLEISFMGYDKKTYNGIQVSAEKFTFLNEIKMNPASITTKVIEIIEFQDKIIDPEGGPLTTLRSKELEKMADTRDVSSILRAVSTDFKVSSDGSEIYFRGSRNGASAFYIDGLRVENMNDAIPGNAIGIFNVYSGGIPAKYGDFTGGVVVIESKSYFEQISEWQHRMRKIGKE